jgi:gluconolactonase
MHTALPPDLPGRIDEGLRPLAIAAFLEGPACAADGTLYCSDIAGNRILRLPPDATRFDVFRTPSGRANGLLFDPQGRLLICEGNEFGPGDGGRRLTRLTLASGELEVLCDGWDGRRLNSPNDVACTSQGHVFFTDPCYGDRAAMELDHDSVFHVDPDGRVEMALSQPDIQRPNGVHLSPDEQSLYVVDSCPVIGGHRRIWKFELDSRGRLSGRSLVYDFAPGRGGDGMTVDSDGLLYVAAGIATPRGPHETTDVPPGIYVLTPHGELRRRIPVSEDVLTNATFGGPDMQTLYVTAGKSLFSVRTDARGWAVHRPSLR